MFARVNVHGCQSLGRWGVGGARWAQVSMMDEEVFQNIWGVLSTADGVRRDGAARGGTAEARDSIGDLHLLVFGEFLLHLHRNRSQHKHVR